MKVVCIESGDAKNGFPSDWMVIEGETYTVLRETTGYYRDGSTVECFVLAEQPDKLGPCFEKSRFIPLSDIDETELERNYDHSLYWFDKLFIEPLTKL